MDYWPQTDTNPFGSPSLWKFFGNNSDGIYLAARASGNTIAYNLCAGNFSVGIELLHETASYNEIYGNKVGMDITATYALPNGELGIILSNGAHHNLVGGDNGPNLIAGHPYAGIELGGEKSFKEATYNLILGNHIGCNLDCDFTIGRQQTGIHLGTSQASNNVLVGNTLVGNDWGIYLEGAQANFLINNYVGTTKQGKNLGNRKAGIVFDKAFENTSIMNVVVGNGFATEGHEDWFFGMWDLNGVNNKSYGDYVENNKTGSNLDILPLTSTPFVDPTNGVFIPCAKVNETPYFAYLRFLGNESTEQLAWQLEIFSVGILDEKFNSESCLSFTEDLKLLTGTTLTYNERTYPLNLLVSIEDDRILMKTVP